MASDQVFMNGLAGPNLLGMVQKAKKKVQALHKTPEVIAWQNHHHFHSIANIIRSVDDSEHKNLISILQVQHLRYLYCQGHTFLGLLIEGVL